MDGVGDIQMLEGCEVTRCVLYLKAGRSAESLIVRNWLLEVNLSSWWLV